METQVGFYKAKKKKKLNIFVIRIRKNGELGGARPCCKCLQLMKVVGIKKVWYSVNSGDIICENVSNMLSISANNSARLYDNLYNYGLKDPSEYFSKLIERFIPKNIKRKNLKIFLKHNLCKINEINYKITKNKIEFYNKNNILIKISFIM